MAHPSPHEVLAHLGKELASSLEYEEVLDRLARALVPVFADWCVVDVVERGFEQHVAVAHIDPAKEELARELQRLYEPISSPASPMRHVLESGQPRWVAELNADITVSGAGDPRYLELVGQLDPRSLVSVPLAGRTGALGVMSFLQSDSNRRFSPKDVELAQEVAERAALAIENAQLYRDVQRREAERRASEDRQRLLTEISQVLTSSLDYQPTLEQLARLVVPELADWCVVDIPEGERRGPSLAIAHSDPRKVRLARELQERWPPGPDDTAGVSNVIRTGQPQLYQDISEELLAGRARDQEHLRVLRELGPWTSGMTVPLRARGQILGALTLISAESGRRYTQDDLAFALELANRAALAVDNARLYTAEQRARREAERLQQLTQKLGTSLALQEVLDQVAATAAELLEAPIAGVFLMNGGGDFELIAGRGVDVSSPTILPRDRSIAGRVVRDGRPATVSDTRAAAVAALPRLVSAEAVGSLVVAPIMSSSGPLGVVEVYSSKPGHLGEHEAELLTALAGAAAAILENARLYEQRSAALARLEALIQQLPVGVLVVDASSTEIALKNQQVDDLFGAAVLESINIGQDDPRRGFHVDGTPYQPTEWPISRALNQGETVTGERIEVVRPNGERAWLSVNAAPIRDEKGAIAGAVSVYDDVSADELLRRQKDQFLLAAAHDLKTPLTSIRGLAQLLQRQLQRLDPDQPERAMSTLGGLESATRKMAALIDELLDISRLQIVGELSLSRSRVDLGQLAERVVAEHRSTAQRHTFVLEGHEDGVTGCWDEPRLERVISNLVGNAVKYCPDGGEVRVRIGAEQEGDRSWAVLSVSDQGIGIPAGDIDHIFERFRRGSNIPERLSGSGIGLGYVRQVVEQHEGAVAVQSEPGRGSTFTIRLPMEAG
jgi:PAS domain S-box-containing protein